ncbi:MAG: DUF4838 domain-containing protein [Phycisphaeraceae bacterium]
MYASPAISPARLGLIASCLGLLLWAVGYAQGAALSADQPAPPAAALAIARDGKALVPIVIAPVASDATKAVAAELAEYLGRVTGGRFEVQAGDGAAGPCIVLGTLAQFPQADLVEPLEIRNGHDGKEAYAIRTEPGRVLLLGATDLGASHAAYRFLEMVGCRWFFPAKEWEVIPSIPQLAFGQNEISRPVILSRTIGYGCGFLRDGKNGAERGRGRNEYEAWCRHNLMASSLKTHSGHMWRLVINKNKAEFDQHPEYYALVDGQRREGGKFEVANPVVRKMVVDFVLNAFRKDPDRVMQSVEPADGKNQSESPESKALGTFSDQVFGLANEVARAVQKEYPGKMVGLLAYGWHSDPPAFDMEPNVYVQMTVGFTYSQFTDQERMDLWATKCRNLGFYEYYSVFPWDLDRLPGGRAANLSYLQSSIRMYAQRHAIAVNAESSNNWGVHGLGYYVANRLMWNPEANVEALVTDFLEKAFGPAAPAMRRYYARFDHGNKTLWSKHELAMAFRDVAEAAQLAKDCPDVLARLDHLKQYLHYNHLYWKMDHTKNKDERKALTLAILTHSYRTRYTNMNHWEAIRQLWTGKAAEQFGEPTWDFRDPSPNKPWEVQAPVTHEETEENFRQGLAHFQPQLVTPRTFSEDLVPVQFAGAPAIASTQSWQNELPRYAFYSVAGEPLQMDFQVGIMPNSEEKGEPRYTISDSKGTPITQGRLSLQEKEHHLVIKVPHAGLYYLTISKSGGGWQIDVAADRPACMVVAKDWNIRALARLQDLYFYVPRGTRQIEYLWQGGPHKVFGPEGKLVLASEADGEFVIVPVPPGQDGQVWHLSVTGVRRLWFFNVPNYLAASPNALLIPREVAKADELSIRQ